jgi:3-deoxy-D-manno-octulosonic-acid transferase
MILALYRVALTVLWPLIRLYLALRMRRGKEDPLRFRERLGEASLARPAGSLIWLHAASVGESLSLLPLIERLGGSQQGLVLLVTTGTVTSARLLADRLPEGVHHQYVPVDRLACVRRFLDHWRPDLVLWAESEFWPNILCEARRRAIPMILINGRVSAQSFRRWQRAPRLIRNLVSGFSFCLSQTEEDAGRLRALGAVRSVATGNLKFVAPPLPADGAALETLDDAMVGRPRWLAASTHAGEELIAGRIHCRLKQARPDLLTVIVPRHAERGPEIAMSLEAMGLTVARRAAGQPLTPETDVYLADSMGELGLFYRLIDIVFVGKSLSVAGGQNPLEPARLGCALVYGPHMENFSDMASRLVAGEAACMVADEAALGETIERLLLDGALRGRMARAAAVFASGEDHVLDATLVELRPYLNFLMSRKVVADESA